LSGPSTYPAWIRSIEKYLDIIEIPDSEFRLWDVVIGVYTKPSPHRVVAPSKTLRISRKKY